MTDHYTVMEKQAQEPYETLNNIKWQPLKYHVICFHFGNDLSV